MQKWGFNEDGQTACECGDEEKMKHVLDSAPSCHNPVPMKTWKSSTPELDPAPSIGRESCSDSRRRRLNQLKPQYVVGLTARTMNTRRMPVQRAVERDEIPYPYKVHDMTLRPLLNITIKSTIVVRSRSMSCSSGDICGTTPTFRSDVNIAIVAIQNLF